MGRGVAQERVVFQHRPDHALTARGCANARRRDETIHRGLVPANLDQAREFETRVAPVDFAIFFDVEPPPEVGVAGGPDDPEDRDRKAYEAFAAKHAVVLNEYKSNGMVHHVRSPPDRAHVTLAPRAATVGPMRRGFYRGERVPSRHVDGEGPT